MSKTILTPTQKKIIDDLKTEFLKINTPTETLGSGLIKLKLIKQATNEKEKFHDEIKLIGASYKKLKTETFAACLIKLKLIKQATNEKEKFHDEIKLIGASYKKLKTETLNSKMETIREDLKQLGLTYEMEYSDKARIILIDASKSSSYIVVQLKDTHQRRYSRVLSNGEKVEHCINSEFGYSNGDRFCDNFKPTFEEYIKSPYVQKMLTNLYERTLVK